MEVFKHHKPFSLKTLFHKDSQSVFDIIIRITVYLTVFLVPIFFLTVTQSYYELNKTLIFCILTIIGVIAWLAKIVFRKGFNFRRTFLDIPLVVFGLLYILVTLFSKNWYDSLIGQSNYFHHTLPVIIILIMFYFLVVNNFRKAREITGLISCFLISTAIVAVVGLLQILKAYIFISESTHYQSFNLVFNSVTIVGILLAIVMPVILSFLVIAKKNIIRFFLILFGLVNFVVLALLDMNLVWYILIGGLFVFLLFLTLRSREIESRWVILPTVLLVLAAVLIFVDVPNITDIHLPSDIILDQGTTWSLTRSTLTESPLFGTGPEMFNRAFSLYRPQEFNNTTLWSLSFIKGSSEFFQILITTGLLVTLVFLFILFRFGLKLKLKILKERNDNTGWFVNLAIFLPWAALLVISFFYPFSFVLSFTLWFLMTLGASLLTQDKGEVIETRSSASAGFFSSIAFSMLIVLGIVFIYGASTIWLADYHYVKGTQALNKGDNIRAEKEYNQATKYNQHEALYHFSLAQSFIAEARTLIPTQSSDDLNRVNELTSMVQVATTNGLNIDRNDPLNYQSYITVYSNLSQFLPNVYSDLANFYDQMIKLDKNNPSAYLGAGDNSIAIGNEILSNITEDQKDQAEQLTNQANESYTQAIDYYNQASQLKTGYIAAEIRKGLVYELMGNPDQAITYLEDVNKKYADQVDLLYELGRLYNNNDKKDLAKEKFIEVLNLSPDHANAAFLLAGIVEAEGDTQSAIQLYTRVLSNNPDDETVRKKLENLGITIQDERETENITE